DLPVLTAGRGPGLGGVLTRRGRGPVMLMRSAGSVLLRRPVLVHGLRVAAEVRLRVVPLVEVSDRALVGVAELLEPRRPLLLRGRDRREDVLVDEAVLQGGRRELLRVVRDLVLQGVIEGEDLAVRVLGLSD